MPRSTNWLCRFGNGIFLPSINVTILMPFFSNPCLALSLSVSDPTNMKLATAFFLASIASPAVALKTNKIRRGDADEYTPDALLEPRNLATSGTGKSKSKSRESCVRDEPCDVNSYASYGFVDYNKYGELRYDFRYDVKCATVERFRGCCYTDPTWFGKECVSEGGVWIADADSDATFSCCDPALFEDLLNSKYCVVDGSKGPCYDSDDDCTPIRYSTGYGRGGGNGAASGIFSGIAGCDEDKVLEIFNDAPQCIR